MDEPRVEHDGVVGPIDAVQVPRYAGFSTFARLPRIDDVERFDCAVVGIPFDRASPTGRVHASARGRSPGLAAAAAVPPGARCRAVSWATGRGRRRHRVQPVQHRPGDRADRSPACRSLAPRSQLLAIGGDHTIALPMLRVMHDARPGRAGALRRAPRHVGHLLRRAVHTRHAVPARVGGGAAAPGPATHVGIRGPLYAPQDLVDDQQFGFPIVRLSTGVDRRGRGGPPAARPRGQRAGLRVDRHRRPRPSTRAGHRYAGGWRADHRELLAILRGSRAQLVGADSSRSPRRLTTRRSPRLPRTRGSMSCSQCLPANSEPLAICETQLLRCRW